MINKRLSNLVVDIAGLRQDPKNARKHNNRSLESVVDSLKQFGQQKPIVALEDGTVIAGNATLKAALSLGWNEIAVSYFLGTHEQAVAYALADNRTSELSEWNAEVLLEQVSILGDQFNLDVMGLSAADLGEMLNDADEEDDPYETDFEIDGASFLTVKLTPEQAETVRSAINRVKEIGGIAELDYARGIELICADYLGG